MVLSQIKAASLAVLGIACISSASRAAEFPLAEYDKHVGEYISSLANLAFDFTATDHSLDGRTRIQYECALISMPGHFRVKCVFTTKTNGGVEGSKTEWILLRPDGYFVIAERGEGQYTLRKTQAEIRSPLSVNSTTPIAFLMTPVREVHYPLNELIRGVAEVSFKVKSFRQQPESSDAAFLFETSDVSNGERCDSEFQLNEKWLVTRFKLKSQKSGVRILREISYTSIDGRMVPSRISLQRSEKDGRVLQPGFLAEFRNYRAYRASAVEFGFAQFGLPEPVGASSMYQGRSRWWLWITLGGAVAAILGFLFVKVKPRYARCGESRGRNLVQESRTA